MRDEQDPALQPEDTSTVADPQAKEDLAESPEQDAGEGAGAQRDDKDAKPETEAEIEITVEGEEPPPKLDRDDVAWARLRKEQSELKRRNAELERELKARTQPQQADDPGPEPTLESCSFNEAELKRQLREWNAATARKATADEQAKQQAEVAQASWKTKLEAFAKGREELAKKVPDYADAEAAVKSALNPNQLAALVEGTDNPALVIAALGRNPKLLEGLAKETSLVRLSARAAKLEVSTKMKPKTQVPPPDQPVRGSGAPSGSGDSRQKQLRAEAEKSGDYTALNAYNREKRQQR